MLAELFIEEYEEQYPEAIETLRKGLDLTNCYEHSHPCGDHTIPRWIRMAPIEHTDQAQRCGLFATAAASCWAVFLILASSRIHRIKPAS